MNARLKQNTPFPRRPNTDGTFDLICPRCYLTVARGTDLAVDAAEERHCCDGLASLRRAQDDAELEFIRRGSYSSR